MTTKAPKALCKGETYTIEPTVGDDVYMGVNWQSGAFGGLVTNDLVVFRRFLLANYSHTDPL